MSRVFIEQTRHESAPGKDASNAFVGSNLSLSFKKKGYSLPKEKDIQYKAVK